MDFGTPTGRVASSDAPCWLIVVQIDRPCVRVELVWWGGAFKEMLNVVARSMNASPKRGRVCGEDRHFLLQALPTQRYGRSQPDHCTIPCHRYSYSILVASQSRSVLETLKMYCQKCRTPLKVDPSLDNLNPAAFDLLVGKACTTCTALRFPDRNRLNKQSAKEAEHRSATELPTRAARDLRQSIKAGDIATAKESHSRSSK